MQPEVAELADAEAGWAAQLQSMQDELAASGHDISSLEARKVCVHVLGGRGNISGTEPFWYSLE